MVSIRGHVLPCLENLHERDGSSPSFMRSAVPFHALRESFNLAGRHGSCLDRHHSVLGEGLYMLWQAATSQRAHMMSAVVCAGVIHVSACVQAAYVGSLGIAFAANTITHIGLVLA